MSDWLQTNWYEFGSILIQFAILATLAWFGRSLLRIVRTSVTQTEVQPEPTSRAARAEYGGGVSSAWNGLVIWLQTPMGSGGVGPFRRVIRWFQAPMGS